MNNGRKFGFLAVAKQTPSIYKVCAAKRGEVERNAGDVKTAGVNSTQEGRV